jgi:hypothetical protein
MTRDKVIVGDHARGIVRLSGRAPKASKSARISELLTQTNPLTDDIRWLQTEPRREMPALIERGLDLTVRMT